jgi:hypothetical protein
VEREVRALRQANGISNTAAAFFAGELAEV